MISDTGEGMRARKKRQTANAIELAAVTGALEKGHENLSVEEICERADVSRSTFFNYVPTRESAIFGAPIPLADDALVAQILADDSVPLTTSLLRVMFASVGHSLVNPEVAAGRMRLSVEQPETRHLIAAPIIALLSELTSVLTGWLEQHDSRRIHPAVPAEKEARYVIALVGAAFQSLLIETSGVDDVVLPERVFESAIDEIVAVAEARSPRSRERTDATS